MARNDPVITIGKILGLNNVQAPEELKRGEMVELANVDVTDAQHARQRPGFVNVNVIPCHSVGGSPRDVLLVQPPYLTTVDPATNTITRITTLQAPTAPMAYATYRGMVFYSNGTDKGAVHSGRDAGWGQEPPGSSPELISNPDGALPPGQYRVCTTALSATGEESPPTPLVTITLPETGGITITRIVHPPGATWVRVYATAHDGATFKLANAVPTTIDTVSLVTEPRGLALSTYGLAPLPPGQALGYFRGRMLVAADDVLWWSEPYHIGLMDPSRNFVSFPGRIISVMPVDEGVVVCYDGGVVYLRGVDPATFVWIDRGTSQAVPGTEAPIPSDRFGTENQGVEDDSWVWLSDQGFMAATHEGEVLDLLSGRVDVDAGARGAGVFDLANGSAMYRGTIQNPSPDTSTFGFKDRTTAEVYRNGVRLGS
jgi:hypothetical protein